MEHSSHARLVAMRLLSASNTPEKQQAASKTTQLCLSPTDPSEDPVSMAMASPVLSGKSTPAPVASPSPAKNPLPGLQFAISSQRAPSRELRLPSLSNNAPFELESVTPAVSSGEEEEPTTEKTRARRKKGTRRGTLHPEAKNVLKAWMFSPEHFAHPYPSEEEKEELANEAGIEVKQLSNWFTNARKRLWQPVLRQSGVEVKNFLSTGRGGPRGNKLDVPPNLHQLVSQSPVQSPPSSPRKRSWSSMNSRLTTSPSSASPTSSVDDNVSKRRKSSVGRKRVKANSHESNQVSELQEMELLAATSLLGLHSHTQSVH